jgi:uncharacterized protein (TIGR03435 family)
MVRWVTLAAATAIPLFAQTAKPAFEVASIKPRAQSEPARSAGPAPLGVFYRAGDTVSALIQFAYSTMPFQIVGGPEWARRDRFEINAKAAPGDIPSDQQMRLMVQSLLEDRFKLVVRREQRDMSMSALVMARSDGRAGPKLEKCEDPANAPPLKPLLLPPGSVPFSGRCRTMAAIAATISRILDRLVIDRTGLSGSWTYQMVYAQPQPLPPGALRDLADQAAVGAFSTALQEELGLEVESGRGTGDVLVIESVQQPTEN